jgi:hypothetical protein
VSETASVTELLESIALGASDRGLGASVSQEEDDVASMLADVHLAGEPLIFLDAPNNVGTRNMSQSWRSQSGMVNQHHSNVQQPASNAACVKVARHLIESRGFRPSEIIILSFSPNDVNDIATKLHQTAAFRHVRVNTVDYVKDCKAKVVILQLRRMRLDQEIGVSMERNHLGYAISRTQQSLLLVGDWRELTQVRRKNRDVLDEVLDFVKEHGYVPGSHKRVTGVEPRLQQRKRANQRK